MSNTSGVAKLAEQSMAVSEFILCRDAAQCAVLHLPALGKPQGAHLASRILGVALGIATAWASNRIEVSSSISPGARAIWIIALFLRRSGLGLPPHETP